VFTVIIVGKKFKAFSWVVKRQEERKKENFGAKGNILNNHKVMGSLRMFGARGFLLIFIALGTNGQLLTEKIPLGKVFAAFYGNL
jgi:hypothetical protein